MRHIFSLSTEFIPFPYLRHKLNNTEYSQKIYDTLYYDKGRVMDAKVLEIPDVVKSFEAKDWRLLKLFDHLADGTVFSYHRFNPFELLKPQYEWFKVSLDVNSLSCMFCGDGIFLGVELPQFVKKHIASPVKKDMVKKVLSNSVTREMESKVQVKPFAIQYDLYDTAEYIIWLSDKNLKIFVAMRPQYFDLAYFLYYSPTFHVDPNFANIRSAHVVEIRTSKIISHVPVPKSTSRRDDFQLGGFNTAGIVNGLILPDFHDIPKNPKDLRDLTYMKKVTF